jgi:hypothetical protein
MHKTRLTKNEKIHDVIDPVCRSYSEGEYIK